MIGALNHGTVTDSFWDTDTSGQSISAGGVGKHTSEMMSESTFTNWDFGGSGHTWKIVKVNNEGISYPYHNWRYTTTPTVISGTAYSDDGVTHIGGGKKINLKVNGLDQ